jgi:D-alanyl-D-alanine carboxypeptidase
VERLQPQQHRELESGLKRFIERAADDPCVPSVLAAVHWPRRKFAWSAAIPGVNVGAEAPAPQVGDGFRIASVTKLHVAAAVLKLVESGQVDLVSPLAGLIRADTRELLDAAGYDTRRIVLDMLLTHTSGLPDHVKVAGYSDRVIADPAHRWTRAEQVALATGSGPPLADPGQYFCYSDTGYVLLGEVIEAITGQTLAAAVRRLVGFEALGLRHTYWESQEPVPADARRRTRQFLGPIDATGFDPSFDLHGGGGLVSTVHDLAAFADALVGGRVFEDPSTLAAGLVIPPARREAGAHLHSRLAMVLPLGSRFGWGHLGFWGCLTACCPELGLSVAVTVNQSAPQRDGLALAVAGELVTLTEEYFTRR